MNINFDSKDAQLYGINAAIILSHLTAYTRMRYIDGGEQPAIKDGALAGETRYFLTASVAKLARHFQFLTQKQVRDALAILLEHGVVICNRETNEGANSYALADVTQATEGIDIRPFGKEKLREDLLKEANMPPDTSKVYTAPEIIEVIKHDTLVSADVRKMFVPVFGLIEFDNMTNNFAKESEVYKVKFNDTRHILNAYRRAAIARMNLLNTVNTAKTKAEQTKQHNAPQSPPLRKI